MKYSNLFEMMEKQAGREAKMGLKAPRLPRIVHWRKGNWVVVQGPFPDPFYRSETRDSPEKASKLYTDECYNRPGTTKDDQYAKVRAEDILEILSGENEFGPVTP
jgi:hypothetical protein